MLSNQIWRMDDIRAVVDAGGLRVSIDDLPDASADAPIAYGRVWHTPIRPGLAATGYDVRYLVELQTVQRIGRSLVIALMLAGRTVIESDGVELLALHDRSIGIATFADGATILGTMPANVHSTLAGLLIEAEFLDQLDDLENGAISKLRAKLGQGTTAEVLRPTPMAIHVARQMTHNPYHGTMGALFAESRAITFLFEIARILDERRDGAIGEALRPAQQERLSRAREILDGRLANPPSLADLARETGLSVAGLRKAFAQAFGETVFGYVRRRRLEEAQLLLVTEGLSVSEVAWRVGFSDPSNFASAFRRRFGYAPSEAVRRL